MDIIDNIIEWYNQTWLASIPWSDLIAPGISLGSLFLAWRANVKSNEANETAEKSNKINQDSSFNEFYRDLYHLEIQIREMKNQFTNSTSKKSTYEKSTSNFISDINGLLNKEKPDKIPNTSLEFYRQIDKILESLRWDFNYFEQDKNNNNKYNIYEKRIKEKLDEILRIIDIHSL